MVKKVLKYELPMNDFVEVDIPAGAQVVSVQSQGDGLYIWALVDPLEEITTRRIFRIAGTGHPITDPEKLRFIGTVLMYRGGLVFHVFEVQ